MFAVCGDPNQSAGQSEVTIQNEYGFFNDRVCYYTISAPKYAKATDTFSVTILSLTNTKINITIA